MAVTVEDAWRQAAAWLEKDEKMELLRSAARPNLDRAIRNSPPPLDDVGSDVSYMLDEKDPTLALIVERQKTHGSFSRNARYGQELRDLFRASPGWAEATGREREALDYIAGKLSRILSGRPDPQHWEDIAGYAALAGNPDLQD